MKPCNYNENVSKFVDLSLRFIKQRTERNYNLVVEHMEKNKEELVPELQKKSA